MNISLNTDRRSVMVLLEELGVKPNCNTLTKGQNVFSKTATTKIHDLVLATSMLEIGNTGERAQLFNQDYSTITESAWISQEFF